MKAQRSIVYEGNQASRVMYYDADGACYTPEQYQLKMLMERLEKKIDALTAALESSVTCRL